jgi:hypothetical protein
LVSGGCSSFKKELGVGRNSPDEFAVVKRAPLSLPPDYDLRPPSAENMQAGGDASGQARAALLGKSSDEGVKGAGEKSLLGKIGASSADPEIRNAINKDNGAIALQNRSVADKLIFWKDEEETQDKVPASVVDPKAEKDRLKNNKDEGKPVNDGNVPTIEKKQGTFDKIFH